MTWNNGDASDVNNGGLGNDTVLSNGNDLAAETYTYEAGAQAGRVLFKRTSAGAFQIDLEAESLVINSLGGDDSFGPVGTGIAGRTTIAVMPVKATTRSSVATASNPASRTATTATTR